jgi:hypothetical protein
LGRTETDRKITDEPWSSTLGPTVLEKLTGPAKHDYVSPTSIALIYVGLGEKDKAFELLQKFPEVTSYLPLKVDPVWDRLRPDPRFQDVLRHVNLQP